MKQELQEILGMLNPGNWDLGVYLPFAVFAALIVFIALVAQ